jgi:hypothetical protein
MTPEWNGNGSVGENSSIEWDVKTGVHCKRKGMVVEELSGGEKLIKEEPRSTTRCA